MTAPAPQGQLTPPAGSSRPGCQPDKLSESTGGLCPNPPRTRERRPGNGSGTAVNLTKGVDASLPARRAARSLFEARQALPTIVDQLVTGRLGLRMVQDELQRATAAYWEARAEVLDDARPRPGEFTGNATVAELEALDAAARADAQRCRRHAALLSSIAYGTDLLDEIATVTTSSVCDSSTRAEGVAA